MRTKIYLILLVCLGYSKIFAQSYEEQYLQQEQTRLNQVKVIENEIQSFINQNINTYDFTEVINNVDNMKDEEGNSLSGNSYEETLLQAKKQKLRDVFFQQNPEKLKYYYATTLKQQCVNGGFENGNTTGFSFFTKAFNGNNYNIPFNYSSNPLWQTFNNNPITTFSPSTTSLATVVDNSINDPVLAAAPTPITLARVRNGRYAIRLNNNSNASYDVTKMTRQFTVNQSFISYAFALVFENAGHLNQNQNTSKNPYYQVILRNNSRNNQVVFERRVMANQSNPLFTALGDSILYTQHWGCEYIDTSNIIGDTVTLEIYVADCGEGGHWGYGYFDDFCGIYCGPSSFESNIFLHPLPHKDCPDSPVTVTGSVTLPSDASLTNITLVVVDASNNVVTTRVLNTAPGGFFSTDFYYNDFYPNGYNSNTDFNILAYLYYSINGNPHSPIFTNNTNPPGPDISFKDCPRPCQEEWTFLTNQPITASENFSAFGSIYSQSLIYPNLDVVFRAAYDIQLTPGFYTTSHQSGKFHAYIAPCDENGRYSTSQRTNSEITKNNSYDTDIKIYPNPTSTIINIDSGNEKITSWELLDISGRSVLKGSSTQINVQGLPKTTYLLNININNKIITKKVIVK